MIQRNSSARVYKKLYSRTFSVLLILSLGGFACTQSIAKNPTQKVSEETQELSQQTQLVEVPVVLAARFKIKPEKRSLFLELAGATLSPTRAEAGNISYSFYEESTVPNSFIYFEEWKSREALKEHLKAGYTQRLLERFAEMLDGEANIRVYDIESLTYGLEVDQ